MTKILRILFSIPCHECGEVRVLFWRIRCSLCDHNEGGINSNPIN